MVLGSAIASEDWASATSAWTFEKKAASNLTTNLRKKEFA
jgi:hypothetical protein